LDHRPTRWPCSSEPLRHDPLLRSIPKVSQDPVDIVSLLVALLALIVSKEIATLVGPYAAIFVLACAGAALALSGTEKVMVKWWEPVVYVSIRVLLAVVLTVALAELLQKGIPWAQPRYTLVPLAFGISWIDDYKKARAWVGETFARWTSKRLDDGK